MQIIFELILNILTWAIFLPVVLIIATPYILISSFIGENSYLQNLNIKYRKVIDFWIKHGQGIT